ncbi:MAG TPA: glycosyltransferase family 39 protein [Chitinophagales bacterium]|nr:glycosyltransferase family 39 protein [Chitinophagales bacterium]
MEHRPIKYLESPLQFSLLLLLLGLLLFLPYLGSVHLFDWDEINFAESAREMILTQNFHTVQVAFKAFWEKPPLFFWLQSLSMHLFGINEMAARLPNALFGCMSLLTLYHIGRNWHNENTGRWWAMLYMGSFLPHLYFKSGIIDPVFNYFIFVSLFFLSKVLLPSTQQQTTQMRFLYWIMGGAMAGLALLTKGPVALLLLCLSIGSYWTVRYYYERPAVQHIAQQIQQQLLPCIAALLTMLLVASLWVISEIQQHGTNVLFQFIEYQIRLFSTPDAGHQQPFYYHWVVVLIGCFPLSILALPQCFQPKHTPDTNDRHLHWLMMSLLLVVLVVFSIVKTKIVHYSSLSYFPLSYIAARHCAALYSQKVKMRRATQIMIAAIGTVFALLLIAVPLVGMYKNAIIPYIKDPFAVGNLSVEVPWCATDAIIGVAYLVAVWVASVQLKTKTVGAIQLLLATTAITLFTFTAHIVPKIEAHSQRTFIDFCRSKAGQDVYIETVGFKSYAKYFYFQLPPNHLPPNYSDEWLLTDKIDKDAYLITKTHRKKLVTEICPNAVLLEDKGGFAFFVRKAAPRMP